MYLITNCCYFASLLLNLARHSRSLPLLSLLYKKQMYKMFLYLYNARENFIETYIFVAFSQISLSNSPLFLYTKTQMYKMCLYLFKAIENCIYTYIFVPLYPLSQISLATLPDLVHSLASLTLYKHKCIHCACVCIKLEKIVYTNA